MIESLINELAEGRSRERDENDYLLQLQTEAEGVGSIQYGDDTSHGTSTGDRLEKATIKLAEARQKIAGKRAPRFEVEAEACDWFYDYLKPEPARVMVMYVVDGMTYRQIAEKTGRSIGWVSGTVNEAKRILK